MDVLKTNADLKRVGKRLEVLAHDFDGSHIEPLRPVLAPDRDETRLWVEIRHGGQRDGVGVTRWTTIEAQRFANPDARLIAAADFLHEHGSLSEVERELLEDISWTTFDRFLDSPRLRDMLGLGWEDRTLMAKAPKEEIAKGLRSVAFAVATGEFTSRKHNKVDDRVAALNALPEGSLPDPTMKIAPVRLSELTGSEVATSRSKPVTKKRAKPDPKTRDKLFKKIDFDVTDNRILGLFYELCGLSVKRTPNACAVLLRVFLEMSVVHYLNAKGVGIYRSGGHQAELHVLIERAFKKLKEVDASLDLNEIEKIVEARTVKGRMGQLHDWVHTRNIFPSHSDLVAMADELTPFLAAIWKEESDA